MIARSRPLRALVFLLGAWTAGRAAYEFGPLMNPVEPVVAEAPLRLVTMISPVVARAEMPRSKFWPAPQASAVIASIHRPSVEPLASKLRRRRVQSLIPVQQPELLRHRPFDEPAEHPLGNSDALPDRSVTRQRLSLSGWLLVREGANSLATAGTLGGAQAGVRAYLPLTKLISGTARVSTPLRTIGAEASMGVAMRHGPLILLLERRVALERGARNDFSATVAAGIDGVRLPKQFRLDAYGQAGIVGRDGFADGAVRIERRIGRHGKSEIAVGAGVWGGAQPGIARVDAGPQIVVRTPIAGGSLRASGEWRQRIAGNAQPGSGPSLTLGMDF